MACSVVRVSPNAKRHIVGIAGGSGITPVISLIRTALAVEPKSRFTLFYGNRDASSVIFLEALADLKDRYLGRFELYHFLSDEEGDVELFNGMLDRATCRAKVISGKVEMAARYGLTDDEIAAGYVLTCQSVPVGEGVALDYDA